ncbi:MAG: penicillin acylase family protein [Desulfobacteraceae bacterium]|nr:penicillin acylase family protein [Desulfobacteraceae bacterium]
MRRKLFVLFILVPFVLNGCAGLVTHRLKSSVFQNEDAGNFAGLENSVIIKKNNYGIPLIEAGSIEDLVFACGYSDASDRLGQMVKLKLVSMGRLCEFAGENFIELDLFMRSLDMKKRADSLIAGSSDELVKLLEIYSNGVNAYIERHKDNLTPSLKLAEYVPEKWTPFDTASVFVMLNFALSLNFHEEITALHFLENIDADKIPYLFPVYPDEDLPFKEAQKLKLLEKTSKKEMLDPLKKVSLMLEDLGIKKIAASNNWAVSAELAKNKKSILANDTHLPISLPGVWNMKHLKCPEFNAAGISGAGFPAIVAGFNGNIAWGMTMVMADNQDIYVEKIKNIDGKLYYLYEDKWIKTDERKEFFKTKEGKNFEFTVHETIHGPIINRTFKRKRIYELQPVSGEMEYAVSLKIPFIENDDTLEQFVNLNKAKNAFEARECIKEIKTISLNLLFADSENIGWQVTGVYPVRKGGRGLFPSPGWTGEYEWEKTLSNKDYPYLINPKWGFLATANQRTVSKDFPHVLSSSWYYPDRFERIRDMITEGENDFEKMKKMHMDIKTYLPLKLRKAGVFSPFSSKINIMIAKLKEPSKSDAEEILDILSSFDGKMEKDSLKACVYSAFLHCASKRIFFDELGPEDSPQWESFCENEYYNYSPIHDHLLQRDESPFFDDINTEKKETKYEIIALALADTKMFLEEKLGKDRTKWKWGNLHTYYFRTETSKLSKHLGFFKRLGVNMLSQYFNRGPYEAPGDLGTINVSANSPSKNFDVWMIPSMRIIADFSLDEPFYAINSTGQSEHPSSPNYDDGIKAWLNGEYLSFPFKEENMEKVYKKAYVLTP